MLYLLYVLLYFYFTYDSGFTWVILSEVILFTYTMNPKSINASLQTTKTNFLFVQ